MSSPQAGPSGACDAKADNGSLPDDVAALRLALSGYDTTNLSATAILNQEVGAILDELEELEVLLHAVEEPAAAAQILAFCDQAVMGVTHVTERVVAMIEYIPDVAVKETLVERLKVLRGILLSWEVHFDGDGKDAFLSAVAALPDLPEFTTVKGKGKATMNLLEEPATIEVIQEEPVIPEASPIAGPLHVARL